MCGCKCCISDKNIHLSLLSWRDWYLEKLKYQSQNAQNRRSGKKSNCVYETYINTVMPHGRHISAKASNMANSTMCAYPQFDNALTHWKCVLQCCAECPCTNLHYQETDNQYLNITPSFRFHVYHIIARCTAHGIIPLKDKEICHMCKQESSSDESTKYTPEKNYL